MPSLSCEQCDELLPGFVLGAVTPEEAAAIAEHVSTCVRCPAHLAAYESVLDRLGESVPPHEPPAALRLQLRAAVQADVAPPAVVSRSPWQRWWPARGPRWAAVLTVANILLFLASAWGFWQAQRHLTLAQEKWQQVFRQLSIQREALTLLTQPESRRVLLRSDAHSGRGTLLLEATAPQAVLMVRDLPRLQPNREYQLWLVRENTRDNGGTFQVDEQGFGMLLIHAPYPLSTYRAAGITEEPAGGSPGPTSPRVIGGALSNP